MRTAFATLVAGIAISAAGCSSSVAMPNFFNPGNVYRQQNEAVQFDPYPDNDSGPTTGGMRPLDYDQQIPEVDRSRFGSGGVMNPGNWFGRRTGNPRPSAGPVSSGPAMSGPNMAPPPY